MKNIFIFYVFQSKERGKDHSTRFSADLQKGIFQPMIWSFDYKTFFQVQLK